MNNSTKLKTRKILTLCLFFLGTTTVFGQSNAIEKYFDTYQADDSFTKINMSSKAFELMTKIDVEDDELNEMKDLAGQIEQLNVLVDQERLTAKADYKVGLRKLENDYEELMSFSDKGGAFKFFIDESAGIVRELVIFGANDSTLGIISLTGHMDLKKVGQISSKISAQTMDIMEKSHNVDDVLIFPNPADKGQSITINVPEEMKNTTVDIFSSKGELVQTKKNYKKGQKINTGGMTAGHYTAHVQSEGVVIKKKFVIH